MDPHVELWRHRSLVEKYGRLQGWIDDGERVVINSIADEVRGQGILDLGVGAGRTAWLLRLLTEDYVALDWSPEMVSACRSLHPGIDVRVGDAGDLSDFPASRFKLVFFSYNGIDNLGHEHRLRVLDEVRRVVQRDGLFVYSTLAKSGPAYMERPRLIPRRAPSEPAVKHAGRWLYGLVTGVSKYRAALTRWRQATSRAEDHGDWALAPLAALDFEMAHFTTVPAETKALTERGFELVRMVADDGRALESDTSGYAWFHVVARSASGIAVRVTRYRRGRRGRSSGGRGPDFR